MNTIQIKLSTLLFILGTLTLTPTHGQEAGREPYATLMTLKRDIAIQKGQNDARDDIKKGTYKILTYGLTHGPTSQDKDLEKLGITRVAIAGCMVSEGILGYAEGYNTTMEPFLEGKFGDAFKKLK